MTATIWRLKLVDDIIVRAGAWALVAFILSAILIRVMWINTAFFLITYAILLVIIREERKTCGFAERN